MSIDQHVEALRDERRGLQKQLEEARARMRGLEDEAKRIDVAISALTGKRQVGKTKSKPGVTKADVVAAAKAVLEAGPLPQERLKQLVGDRLKAAGKTLTGYPLRLTQALSSEDFRVVGEEVSLG